MRVLVVDDSATARQAISTALDGCDDIELAGTAATSELAKAKLEKLRPDVVVLDLNLDGERANVILPALRRSFPARYVIVTGEAVNDSLRSELRSLGVSDIVAKSELAGLPERLRRLAPSTTTAQAPAPVIAKGVPAARPAHGKRLILIGASTGGVEAISFLLGRLPAATPPIIIVQHMPRDFTGRFAERLNQACRMTVREAVHGSVVEDNTVYIAPGNRHLLLQGGRHFTLVYGDGPPRHGVRPSVDELFESAAAIRGADITAILLTGMGADGALGLKRLRNTGAETIAQDEATSLVYGMPREAALLNAAKHILPLPEIAKHLLALRKS